MRASERDAAAQPEIDDGPEDEVQVGDGGLLPARGATVGQQRIQRAAIVIIIAVAVLGAFLAYNQALTNGQDAEDRSDRTQDQLDDVIALLKDVQADNARNAVTIENQTAQIRLLQQALDDAGVPIPEDARRNVTEGRPSPTAPSADPEPAQTPERGATGPMGPPGPSGRPAPSPSSAPPSPAPSAAPCRLVNPVTGECTIRVALPSLDEDPFPVLIGESPAPTPPASQ